MMSKVSQAFGVLALSAASAVYAQEVAASEQVCAKDGRSFEITENNGQITGYYHQNRQNISSETLANFQSRSFSAGTRSVGTGGNPRTAPFKEAFGFSRGQANLPSPDERIEALRTRGKIFCYTGHVPTPAPGSFVPLKPQ
ncbi:MAG: hypothetical protein H6860_06295 [Rhodospirillales bacterium]|nr:hypothetical protein [Rhodospirillales bacterium]